MIFVIYMVSLLLATGFAQTGIDQDAYDELTEQEQETVDRYYELRNPVTTVSLLSSVLLLGAGLGLGALTGYLWIKKDDEGKTEREGKEPEAETQTATEGGKRPEDSDQNRRETIEGLKDLKSELDERLENDEIDEDEYLKLKRKYDRRIEELES